MVHRAAAGTWSGGRASTRAVRYCLGRPFALAAGAILIALTASPACRAEDPVKGEASFSASGGYARLLLKLAEDVESEVSTAGSVIVIRFKRPVDIPVDKLADAVPDYVASVRRDPDGAAIRLSLARRVTVNTMTAGERIFIDFLPDTWRGQPPSLPVEVVRELAERARAAERALRAQRAVAEAKKRPPVRVRASVQPTFVRFVFEMPDGVGVSSVLNDRKLTLSFNAVLAFDLADAKVAAPPNVVSINQRVEGDTSTVDVALIGDVDVHSFRDDRNYNVDVAFQQVEKPAAPEPHASKAPAMDPHHGSAAAHVPAPAKPAVSSLGMGEKVARDAAPPHDSGDIAPLTSDTFAQQAHIKIKPEPESKASASEQGAAAPAMISAAAEPLKPAHSEQDSHASLHEVPKTETAADVAPSPVSESPPTMTPASSEPPREVRPGEKRAAVEATRDSDGLRVMFSFGAETPAALFRRADHVWLVFDSTQALDVEPIRAKGGAIIGDVSRLPLEKGQAIRIRLNRPQMPSLVADDRAKGESWTLTLADRVQAPPMPLTVVRNITDPSLANISVPLASPGLLHRLPDPDAGDALLVVTAPPPTRGFIKRQDFVELSLLESGHGVVAHPNSEDVAAEVASDKVMFGRPGGLTLSSAAVAAERATAAVRPLFDLNEWRKNQEEPFFARQDALIGAMASAGRDQRLQARLDLANFYMARGMYWEAKGVADLALSDTTKGLEASAAVMLRAASGLLIGRAEQALKDLANPAIGNGYDSQLWKALAFARQGKWADAREKFKNAEFSIATLPPDLQRIMTAEAMRASLEVKDYAGAARRRSELEVVGIPQEMKPAIAVLRGRLAEALGHDKDALDAYHYAANASDRAAAAEGRLLEAALRQKRGELGQPELLRELETISALWRGDGIEVKTLQMMAAVYSDTGRFADSLAAARTSTRLQPNSELSRQGQDVASALFSQLYLGPKGDDLKPVDALAMFYEYRELTPIGRRGDEMIRRLADRLVAVDLLDQAAELLQYQVDKRLEGAARAQVAARLAMIYLTNRKPDRAIAALRSTRIADLSGELRQQRLLLEARAQSDVGRHDLALDIISNLGGREAIRLRSDIYWASRQWREASEQIELYYADRWRDFRPLDATEKGDVIRAVVGYSLAEDAIGLSRFREKYAPLMSAEVDKLAFEVASKPATGNGTEFVQIARMAASVDTLEGFIREMKTRFPDASARAPLPLESGKEPVHTGALPEIVGLRQVGAAR